MIGRFVRRFTLLLSILAAWLSGSDAAGMCPAEAPLSHDTPGSPPFVCACFVPGEQAGAVFSVPATDFPIEILKVGIAWGSQFGGGPTVIEQGLHVYAGSLPSPGAPIFTKPGPSLVDGITNVFDLEAEPGEILVHGGPVMVTLEFLNQSAGGDPFAPSMKSDTDGCQPGRNAVLAQPGGWIDACLAGVPGDWVVWLEYRRAGCREASLLRLDRAPLGKLQLTWNASCLATDWDYDIYEGFVGSFSSHTGHTCSTLGNTTATITPSSGSTYYLVVPTDGTTSGSYGPGVSGNERPSGSVVCSNQQLCP